MMDNQINLINPEIEDHETSKYKKNVNEIIENAEIEAEIEAEKKIRSKNSRIFIISMFGFALISVVYFQINRETPKSHDPFNIPTEISSNLAEIKPAENSITSTPPIKETKIFNKEVQTTSLKPTENALKPINKPGQKSKKIKNAAKIKLTEKIPLKASSQPKNEFIVQTGAFSLKKNANNLVKNLQKKGFNPSVNFIANGSKKFYLVQLGVFQNKDKAKEAQAKLAQAGYSKTIIK